MSSNFCVDDLDQQDALRYRPGQQVELKANPGIVDIITEYDPMMVPPIWLANDPKPRYPHELNVLVKPMMTISWLRLSNRSSAKPPTRPSRVHIATGSK
jgi:hypothetical protein